MGALATATKWIPEDDLLLKNAVEAGASLESLAKGAVCFSRRFTLRELQDRWHSLLYDPDTSAEASARIVDFEIELPISNTSKANRTCNWKGRDPFSHKRKGDSVRNYYYAMRKRVCNEPCQSADLVSHGVPCSCVSSGRECSCIDPLKTQNHHSAENNAVGAPLLNSYEHSVTGFNRGEHAFPRMLNVDSTGTDDNNVQCINKRVDRARLYGCKHNIPPLVNRSGMNHVDQSFEHDYKKDPQVCGENLSSLRSLSNVEENKRLQPLATSNLYDNKAIEEKPFPSSGSDKGKCDGFTGNSNINLQVPDCRNSHDQLGCSSLASALPIWRTIQDVTTPTISKEKEQEELTIHDSKMRNTLECEALTLQAKLSDGASDDGTSKVAIISEGDFLDISSSYMDFGDDDDELLLIDVDEKDIVDTACLSGLSSILLSSPSDTNHENSSVPKVKEVMDSCLAVTDSACSEETKECCDPISFNHDEDHAINVSGENLPSTTLELSHSGETTERVLVCGVNTEDPEIPSNDDIILPSQLIPQYYTSTWKHNEHCMHSTSSSIKHLPSEGKSTVGDLGTVKEEAVGNAQPRLHSAKVNSSVLQQNGFMHSNDGSIVGTESFEGALVAEVVPNSRALSAIVSFRSDHVAAQEEECTTGYSRKHDTFDKFGLLENPVPGPHHMDCFSIKAPDDFKQEKNSPFAAQKCLPSHVAADLGLQDAVATRSNSDQEEQVSDVENDLPSFSDIEAMILGMDLGPYDQESHLANKEVLRYQYMGSKKAIFRLEQGAKSYMNRMISSRGAFAVLYGRHLKYFMKTPEVTLGRETEDIKVDIDLGREGLANKISRQQSIIKMDEGGSFLIKNIGKCSIFINGKEVPTKKCINLSSSSLIEIRDMRFIFEVNQNAVKRYIAGMKSSKKGGITRFDWAPGAHE
ncbi:uncharacterized protein [Typha angustifolia]|uniref:uncharacterized protein isoform X1 n=1 Tax=Typha angustifolia TaxID=59011 RepID=UPI003C2FF161